MIRMPGGEAWYPGAPPTGSDGGAAGMKGGRRRFAACLIIDVRHRSEGHRSEGHRSEGHRN